MQQATCAHSATDAHASSGNNPDLSATRRGALGALLTFPIVASWAAAGATVALDTAAWDAGMAAFLAADCDLAAARAASEVAEERCDASESDRSSVDWKGLEGIVPHGPPSPQSLELIRARHEQHVAKGLWGHDPARARRRSEALDGYQQWCIADRANKERHGLDQALEMYSSASDAFNDAEEALLKVPAPHLAALLWKIERIVYDEGDGYTPAWSYSYVASTIADAQRLLGTGA